MIDADGQYSLKDAIYLLEKAAISEDVLISSMGAVKGLPLRLAIGNYITKGILFFYRSGYRGHSNGYESVQKSLIPKLWR